MVIFNDKKISTLYRIILCALKYQKQIYYWLNSINFIFY